MYASPLLSFLSSTSPSSCKSSTVPSSMVDTKPSSPSRMLTMFPGCHFGKLSGLTTSLSAVVLLLQFPVLHLIREFLHGDPIYVNVGLTLLTLLTFIHPLHVHLHCRSLASQRRARTEQEVTNSGSEVTCNRLVGM
nr:solute carrier family 43 member 3-like isoform X2 [Oncorhynchus nerka]